MQATIVNSFDAGLLTFREHTILKELASYIWFDDSEAFPSLKTLSERLEVSTRWIRQCVANIEQRFGCIIRVARFKKRVCFRRQTSNRYDIRSLVAVLEDRLLQLAEAAKAEVVEVQTCEQGGEAPAADCSGGTSGTTSAQRTLDPRNQSLNSDNNNINSNDVAESNTNSPIEEPSTLSDDLIDLGILTFLARKLVKEHDPDTIRAAIRGLKWEQRRGNVRHPGRWLYRAITQGWQFDHVDEERSDQTEPREQPVDPETERVQKRALRAERTTSEEFRIAKKAAWTRILDCLKERLNPQNFKTWFGPTEYIGSDEEADYIRVPNRFFREWLNQGFNSELEAARAGESFTTVFIELPEQPTDSEMETNQ